MQKKRAARRQRNIRILYAVGFLIPFVLLILLVGALLEEPSGDKPDGQRDTPVPSLTAAGAWTTPRRTLPNSNGFTHTARITVSFSATRRIKRS